jgi:hypothetical protein
MSASTSYGHSGAGAYVKDARWAGIAHCRNSEYFGGGS